MSWYPEAVSPKKTHVRGVALALVLMGAAACAGQGAAEAPDPDAEWRELRDTWDLGSQVDRTRSDLFDRWLSLPGESAGGREAQRRLRAADEIYRDAIERLRQGEPEVVQRFEQGMELGPMDPRLYFPLAEACRTRGLTNRANEYYRKYLVMRPTGENALEAQVALRELPGDPLLSIAPPQQSQAVPVPTPAVDVALGALAGASLTLAFLLLFWLVQRRGVSLAKLSKESPELHPAIAYLVGSLRHELLKHRIFAVSNAVDSLQSGKVAAEETAFLRERLFGGEPLLSAWNAHLTAFERALGYRLELKRDRWFREAGNALSQLARLEKELEDPSRSTKARLKRSQTKLRSFDDALARLSRGLVRASVDSTLLQEAVDEVRSEYTPGLVDLDSLQVLTPDEQVEVEVFRVDLILIVKNIVRNAILAVGRGDAPRAVQVRCEVELEPTGEEVVWILVSDTSQEALTTQALYDRRVDRGLGLVTAALTRYDGSMEVRPGQTPFQKAIGVRFFRAPPSDDLELGENP